LLRHSYIIHFSAADSLTEGRKKAGKKEGKHDIKDFKDLKDFKEPCAPACEPARKKREAKEGARCAEWGNWGAAKFRAESAGIANIH
jgi:hypothetical protein